MQKIFARPDFKKFKEDCLKAGTTEEALANADKNGCNTNLFVSHPFIKNKEIDLYRKFCFNGLWNWGYFGCPA